MTMEKAQLARSQIYEVAFANFLRRQRGYYVLPMGEYNRTGAPALIGASERLTLPDLLAWRESGAAWFDVKVRAHADYHHKTNTLMTGFPQRDFQQYQRIKRLTGLPVWIVFVHEHEAGVFAGEIDTLVISHIHAADNLDRGGTVFFIFHYLSKLFPLGELERFKEAG